MSIRKAVIPAAGLGTRFLPATKATPKEMLPVVDKPAIQYVVDEAAAAGLDDVLVILGRHKTSIADHFDHAMELERVLTEKGDTVRLARVQKSTHLANMHFVRQGEPKGLGHAVSRARAHVGDESFAVLLGDDLIHESDAVLPRMIAEHDARDAHIVALMEVEPEQVQHYGVAAVEATDAADIVRITSLVEKPTPDAAPSNLAVIGRYVLKAEVFDVLARTAPGKGGEIQLTDALNELATSDGSRVYGVIFRGKRFDTGDVINYLKAVVQIAALRSDIAPDLVPWLKSFSASLED